MLHTLNKAWAKILINQFLDQTIHSVMFVAVNEEEADIYANMFRDIVNILTKEEAKQQKDKDEIRGLLWVENSIDKLNPETQTLSSLDIRLTFPLNIYIATCSGVESGMWNDVIEEGLDDILISHEIHDTMLQDFLGRHCKRKCC